MQAFGSVRTRPLCAGISKSRPRALARICTSPLLVSSKCVGVSVNVCVVVVGRGRKGPRSSILAALRPDRAFVSAAAFCRHYQLFLNGERVDTDALSGTWTKFDARTHYYTFDVTSRLQTGVNTVGVMLGLGWRDPDVFPPLQNMTSCDKSNPRVVRLALVDVDSQSVVVASDDAWTGTRNVRS
jgi:hypothetical protein